ncbi:leukotoxin LktA family filamentous adhesin [Methylotenera sp.]|uniref:leukotoxin LktA family filamentous adhesin n=1 Tax=Methylotenera sp. TaxID=2051956 RepID=UPI0024890573|nr:leukotoxin LktA family filamentous adhesin [Methylotenera sp.]MDI1360655.1 leukotoxin LktA family filamentous adhesin [Methylotenera sp.]
MKRSVQGFLSRQYMCVLRRCAWENALSYFINATIAVSGTAAFADGITTDGRTQTQLTVSGSVTDITTKTVQGVNAINSFHRFNIGNGQTVNLYLPTGTANLLNLVHDERSYFDGVLNAYKDGRIGGNVYFLNPHGMVVGAGGVLNVGSLMMATPTSQFMDSLISQSGVVNAGAVSNALLGYIPLTDTGLIQVKGRINAANAVTLSAGSVAVDAGAKVVAGQQAQASFGDLVNIQGLATASGVEVKNGVIKITASNDVNVAGQVATDGIAGANAGTVDIHAGSNITLASGADISANGQGAASSGGNVKIYAEGDATLGVGAHVSANAGSSGDGGFVEFSAKTTVNITGGQLNAGAQNGKAGTVLIDPTNVNWTGSGSDVFSDGTNYQIQATKSIVLDNVFISTRNLAASDNNRANAISAASEGKSGDITLKATKIELKNGTHLLAEGDANYLGGKVTLEARDESVLPSLGWATATAQIDISNTTIKANEVLIDAKSNIDSQFVYSSEDPLGSTLNVATATAQQIGGFLASLAGVELVVSDVNAKAYVNINSGANIEAKTSVTLTAENVTKAGMAKQLPSPGVQFNTPLGIGALWVSDQSDAKVTVGSGATIKSADLTVRAHNNASLEGSIASANNQSENSNFTAIAVGITKADVKATANVASGANIQVSGNLTVAATNVGSYSNEVTSETGPNGRAAAAIAYSDHQSGVTASLNANVGDATKVQVIAINDVLKDQAVALSKVGGGAIDSVVASGKRKVAAMIGAEDFFWGKLGLSVLKPDNKSSPTQQSFRIGGAIAYDTSTHKALAEIGDGAVVHATDSVSVLSRIRAEDMKIAAQSAAISTSASKPSANDTARAAYSVGLAIGDYTHDAVSRVGVDADVTAPKIAVYSDTILPIRDSLLFGSKAATDNWTRWDGLETIMGALNSISNITDVFNGFSSAKSTSDGSNGSINLSGSVSLLSYTDNSRAILDKGAKLNVSGNQSGAWVGGFELQPEVKHYDKLTGAILVSTDLAVKEDFNFAAPVSVQAKHDATLLFQAGEILPAESGEKGLGVAFDQASIASVTEAIVREGVVIKGIDETSNAQPLGSRTWTQTASHATNEVNVSAVSNERVISLAVSGGYGATFGANGTYSQTSLNNATHAFVDDEASVIAKKFNVSATASPVLWSLSGGINMSKNASVGIGIAINDVTGNTRAEIADNDTWSSDGVARASLVTVTGAKITSPDLAVEAKTSGRLEAIAVTGALANNAPNPPGQPGFVERMKNKSGYTALLTKAEELTSTKKSDVKKVDASSSAQEKEKKPPSYSFAGAGSGAINVTEVLTTAKIDGITIDQTSTNAASLVVRAIADSDITAATGAAAITRANDPNTTKTVGVAGSVAVNSIGNGTEAWLKDSNVSNAGDVTVQALSGGEQLAVALGMSVDASKGAAVTKSDSFVGSLSLTLAQTDDNGDSKNKTVAKIDNSTVTGNAATADRDVDVTAYNRTYIGTGGGSLSVQAGSAKSGTSVGAAVSWANVRNDVISGIYRSSSITQVDTVNVHAFNATEIGSGAAMVGLSKAEGANSFAGSMVYNQITNNTTAAIEKSTVTATGLVDVEAKDKGADSSLEALIDPSGKRNNVAKGLDYCGEGAGGASPSGNCITAVAGTVQIGAGNNYGVSIAYNQIENNLTARINDSLVSVTDTAVSNKINVIAESDTSILGVAFGVGVSTGKFSGAGSISIAGIQNKVVAEVGQSLVAGVATTLTAPTVTISSTDDSDINTLAGQVNVSFKASALGAAFAYNEIDNEARAIADNATITASNTVEITATEKASISSLSAAIGAAKESAVSLSASLNFISNATEARLSNSLIEDGSSGTNTVKIKTSDTSTIESISGSAAGGKDNGAGAAFSLNQIGNTNSAVAEDSTIDGAQTLELMAYENATISTLAAALGAGSNGYSGSITLNNIGQSFVGSHPNTTTAELKNSTVKNGNGSTVTVEGKDESQINSIAGALSIGLSGSGFGGAVADNNIQSTAKGTISNSSIQNNASLSVNGKNNSKIKSASVAGAVASGTAFAGSASTNRTSNNTAAEIIGSEITGSASNVNVDATNTSEISALSGGAAVSFGSAAGGIAVSVNQIDDTTAAHVSGKKALSSGYAVKNMNVAATSLATMKALSVGVGASGGNAGAGSIAVNLISSDTNAYIDAGAVVKAENNVGVVAESDSRITVASGSAGLGFGGAGIGVSFTVNSIGGDTSAYIEGATTSVTALAKDANDTMSVNTGELTAGVNLADQIDLAKYNQLDLKSKKAKQDITGVAVNASSTQHIENISTNIAGGSSFAVGAAASVNTIGGTTQAYVLNAKINNDNTGAGAAQEVAITASNISYDNSFIGTVSVGGSAGGLGADTHLMNRTTTAYAAGGSIDAKNAVGVKALSTQGVSSLAVGGAVGGNAGAGTLSMALFTNHTDAYVDSTRVTASDLDINAKNTNDMFLMSGAVSIGGNAVGGAFAVGSSDSTTTATLKNAKGANRVDVTGSVNVEATNKTDINHIVVSGAGGGANGIAGMADVNLVTDKTLATIESSDVGASADKVASVKVAATHTVTIDSKAGALGVGITGGGIGAGASVNIVKAKTVATVTDSNVYSSGKAEVKALSVTHVDATALTAGVGGTVGIGGAAVVTLIGDDVAGESAKEVNKGGSGSLSAVNTFSSGDKFADLPDTGAGGPQILSTSDKASMNADTNKSTTAVTGSAGGYAFKTAAEVNGTNTITAGSLDVTATDKTDTKTLVGGFGASLGGGIGGGVAVTTVKANVAANVSGTALTTNGNVNIKATADNDQGKTIEILAIAGGAGLVGIGAAVSYADISNHVDANLVSGANAGTGTVTVTAEDNTDIDSDAKGAALGALAAGIVVSDISKSSIINAVVGGVVTATAVNISAADSGKVKALGQSAAGGLLGAGSGAFVSASDDSTITAKTANNSTFNLGTSTLSVTATATPQTEAEADGVAVSGGVAIGASIADAKATTTIEASLGSSNTINAGGLTVTAQQLRSGSSESAKSTAWAASGGYLFGGSATTSDADAVIHVSSYVGSNSTLNLGSGTATVKASVDSKQYSKASGINAGIVAAGFNDATATSDNLINAYLGTGVKVTAGTLDVNSGGADNNLADAIAGSGGVFSGAASVANTSTKSTTKAYIDSSSAARNIAVTNFKLTADHTSNFNSTVDSTNASVVGASGAYAHNKVDKSVVYVGIGDGVNIAATSIDVNANNRVHKSAVSGFNVVSASGGLFDAAATHSDTVVNLDTDVVIGSNAKIEASTASLNTQGHMAINALNDVELFDAAKMDSGGAIALAKAESFIYNDQNDADITVGSGALIKSDNTITLETKTLAKADTEVQSKTYGLAGAAQGSSISRVGTSNEISINGARLESDENVVLRAGFNNVITADAETRLWNRTLLPVETSPDAHGQITQDNKITVGAYVPSIGVAPQGASSEDQIDRAAIASVKDIYLQAGEGTHTTRGYGRGTDLYRELIAAFVKLFGANISLDITGGSTSDNSKSSVAMNGTAFAGTHFHQILQVEQDGSISKQSEGMADPTYRNNVDLARDIQARINSLQALVNEYKNDNPDIANGFQADIDTLNAKKARLGVGATADFMDIHPAAAYTGYIFVNGDSLTGTGELLAPGDAKIEIINKSNKFLDIGKYAGVENSLFISGDLGGVITLNGVRVSKNSEINAINQDGKSSSFSHILDRQTSDDPVILVQNTYEDPINLNALNPEIHIDGDISNTRGLVKIDSPGSVQVSSNIVAKTIVINTKGDFIKTFTTGFTHQGGDPTLNLPQNYAPLTYTGTDGHVYPYTLDLYYEDLLRGIYPNNTAHPTSGVITTTRTDTVTPPVQLSSVIAGNNVFISGEKLNINGLIQSGLPSFNVNITQTVADAAVANAGTWIPVAMQENGEAVADLFSPKVRYVNGQIELQSLAVSGGYIQLYGDIFSTGNGRLKVLDGYGKIVVNNTSNKNLAVNRLDTGPGVAGMIKITDTSTKYNGKPLITTITLENDVIKYAYENMNLADYRHPSGVSYGSTRTGAYNTRADRRLEWMDADVYTNYEWATYTKSCYAGCGWGLGDLLSADPGNQTGGASSHTSYVRPNGEWLADYNYTSAARPDYKVDYQKTISPVDYKAFESAHYWTDTCVANICVDDREYYETKREWRWTESNYYVHSLNASKPISIEFSGFKTGELTVNNASKDLQLQGAVRNLTGTTTLTAASINAADTVIVTAKDLNLTASAGNIGIASLTNDASSYIKTNLQTGGKLNATATGGIALWEQDGSMSIQGAHAGGIVNIKSDGDLINVATGVAVSGSSVRLTSDNGAIGSGTAMLVDTTSATGNLSALAAKSIDITESTGDLRLDSVTSIGGDVNLTALNGNIIDDNSVYKVDVEAKAALLAVADRAGLRGTSAAESEQNTVKGYNLAKQQEYARYWQMRNVHKDSNGAYVADAYSTTYAYHLTASDITELKTNQNWTDLQVSQYEARQTTIYHKANQSFGTQAFSASFAYDVKTQDTATYQQLIAGSTWSDEQITNRVAAGIFKDTADTEVLIEDANVVGHNITLTANNGGIGAEKASKSISFVNPNAWTDDERLALAAADRKDTVIDYDAKTITIRQKDDIDITLKNAGQLIANAESDIYIGSEDDIRVKQVAAPVNFDVRIKTGAALINVATSGAAVTGRDITIEAGGADLGSSATPFLINASGTLTARANGDLYVNNTLGNMRLEQVYATNLAKLTSVGSIVEDPNNHNLQTDIQASHIWLTAATTIGEADVTGLKYLDIGSDKLGWVDMSAPDGIYVYSPSKFLNLRNINAGNGEVNMNSFASSFGIIGNVTGRNGVTLNAGEAILFDINGSVVSSNGDIALSSLGYWLNSSSDPLLAEDLTKYGLRMVAGSSILAAGNVTVKTTYDMVLTSLSASNNVVLDSTGGLTIKGLVHSDTSVSVKADNDVLLDGGSITTLGAVAIIAGADGTGSVVVEPESTGAYAIDTASTLAITAANDIVLKGRIRALGNNTLKAGDDIQLKGGSLASNAQVSLTAGTDGTGNVDIGAASNGGNAIYTPASIDITAADDINISGDIRGDVGLVLNAVNGGVNMTGGTLSTGGQLNIATSDTLTIGGDIFGGLGVGLSTLNDVVFAGGSVSSNNDVRIVAGTDGTGSIFGSATSGVDIIALGALTLQAPNGIGEGAPLVAQVTSHATLLSSNINADISTTPLANPLSLTVSDIGGGPAANVVMHVASDKQVSFETFNVGTAEVTAETPSLQLPNGNITNYAVFNMPHYATRIDTLSRAQHLGYDVNAFTLNGSFSLNALENSVAIDSFILIKNPNLQVMGNPTDYVENTVEESLQLQQIGRNGNNPLQFEIGSFGLAAPDDDDVLVNVTTDWIGPTSQLAPVTTENKKEI